MKGAETRVLDLNVLTFRNSLDNKYRCRVNIVCTIPELKDEGGNGDRNPGLGPRDLPGRQRRKGPRDGTPSKPE